MSRFEDRLWSELVEQHGALLAQAPPRAVSPPRPRRRAPLAAIAIAITVALLAIVLGLSTRGGAPAYAVTQNPDGTVTVTIRELVGVQGADNRLAALGVPVRVVPVRAGCRARPSEYTPVRPAPNSARFFTLRGPPGHAAITIDPRAIPAGDTVLVAARQIAKGVVGLGVGLYRGATPPCLPPAPGAGGQGR